MASRPQGAPSPPSPSESSSRVRAGTGGAELSPLRAARGAGGAVSARGCFTSCRPWPPSPLLGAGGCSEPQAGARGDSRVHFFFFPSIWHLNVDEGEEQSELGQSEATQPDTCSRRRRQEPAASAAGGGSRQRSPGRRRAAVTWPRSSHGFTPWPQLLHPSSVRS